VNNKQFDVEDSKRQNEISFDEEGIHVSNLALIHHKVIEPEDLCSHSKTRKNAIVEYLDYQIPVTQREVEICKQQSEIKMRHLPAVDRFKRYGR